MTWPFVLAHALLPLLVAAVAAFGAWRCWRLLRYGRDERLIRLLWFYALFAASLVPMAIRTGLLAASVGADLPLGGLHEARAVLHGQFAAAQDVDVWLVLHHALMLASLGVGIVAFQHGRAAPVVAAAAGLAVLAPFLWVALALEAALTLYLAALAVLNHRRRRSPGALRVAAGFALFFLGHLSFFVLYHPAGVRTPIGDVLSLVGLVILVRLLPRPAA